MGCASSKKIGANSPIATVDVYRPPQSSFSLFDIDAIEEPWLKLESALQSQQPQFHKPSHVPAPLLEKLADDDDVDGGAAPPRPWDEISKALHDFKTNPPPPPESTQSKTESESTQSKKKAESESTRDGVSELSRVRFGGESGGFYKSVRENPFVVMDRIGREKGGKDGVLERTRWDPLGGFEEKCPPGGAGAVVLYTTSLGGVRKTFEDCNRARSVLEVHRVVFDERDVSLHGEFLNELRDLLGDSAAVPRLFIHGRYVGGVDEVVELNETGRLVRILSWAKVERGIGWQGCEGCGGARFVPCLDCGGSCKVVVDGVDKERCSNCNENGLAPCPLCH